MIKQIIRKMREADKAPRRRRLFKSNLIQMIYDALFFSIMVFLPSSWVSSLGLTTIRDYRIEAVKKHINGFLLDIGAGWDNRLVNEYGRGVGIDIQFWENYSNLPSGRLAVCRSDLTCFQEAQFDTVTIVAVLNHIPNREEVLHEVYRVMRKDGHLLMTMVSPWISWINHNLRILYDPDRERKWDEREVWGLTKGEMVDLIEMTGFKLQRRVYYMFGLSCLYICSKAQRDQ